MQTNTIICPYCKRDIELSSALSHELEERVKKQTSQKEKEFQKRLQIEKKEMWRKALVFAQKRAYEKHGENLKLLKEQLQEQKKKLEEAQIAEIKLRKQKRRIEQEKKEIELTVQRRLDKERKNIEEETARRVQEANRLKQRETEKRLADVLKLNDELQRKLEQGSQQTQGEVLELELEDTLRSEFPYDEIIEVPKGIRGADILQKVRNKRGGACGVIIWETKRTKAWSDSWIAKLKQDMRAVKADIAVIISQSLPSNVSSFGQKNGVWVSGYETFLPLAAALRSSLIDIAAAKQSLVGKSRKMEFVYAYLTGPEFQQRIEALVDAFSTMKDELEKEKRAYTRMWAKREKQITQLITHTIGLYGDLQGPLGASLPEIKSLELPEADDLQKDM